MQALMDHIVLNVEDVEKMVSFYHEVVGLGLERLVAYRKGDVPFPSVRLNNDTVIDLFPKRLWGQPDQDTKGQPNLNHFCLACNKGEWDALQKRLEAKHVEIESGPVDRWGAHGTGLSIYFRDPEGNLLEARYYEDDSDAVPCLLDT